MFEKRQRIREFSIFKENSIWWRFFSTHFYSRAIETCCYHSHHQGKVKPVIFSEKKKERNSFDHTHQCDLVASKKMYFEFQSRLTLPKKKRIQLNMIVTWHVLNVKFIRMISNTVIFQSTVFYVKMPGRFSYYWQNKVLGSHRLSRCRWERQQVD